VALGVGAHVGVEGDRIAFAIEEVTPVAELGLRSTSGGNGSRRRLR
jgi:hypothetical protein